MRTTVELPPAALRRAREIAKQRGQSLSSVVVDLTLRGLAQFEEPVLIVLRCVRLSRVRSFASLFAATSSVIAR